MSSACSAALASALCLVLVAGPMPPPAYGQTAARPAELTGALLGLQHEFPETLHKITPELLSLQQQLVEALRLHQEGVQGEERVGQRTVEEAVSAAEAYFRELEALNVMAARSRGKSLSERDILKIRIEARAKVVSHLQSFSSFVRDRFAVGEVTRVDVELAKARALKAEIMLEALRSAAGERGPAGGRSAASATKSAGNKQ